MAEQAKFIHAVERADVWLTFKETCEHEKIDLDSLSGDTLAICLAVLSAGGHVADMIAAAYHDAHGTEPASKSG